MGFIPLYVLHLLLAVSLSDGFIVSPRTANRRGVAPLRNADIADAANTATELPDSLQDAAEIAAKACQEFSTAVGGVGRCRIDFDTSIGDETYTMLKASTEFMQEFVTFACYAMVPGLMEQRQSEMLKVATARAELQAMLQEEETSSENIAIEGKDDDGDGNGAEKEGKSAAAKKKLTQIITSGGRSADSVWKGPTVRIYFPDEGSAALARRDWLNSEDPKVPVCVECASCGGVQSSINVENDLLVFFFCPKASESEYVEQLLAKAETDSPNLLLSIFVNPNLVDMGVTGFGMSGRRLRERLLDGLTNVYYLRTLSWGALTRVWPQAYTVWQEDEEFAEQGGYKLIKTQGTLPSNPEVEDIYDIANGIREGRKEGGILDQVGDFVNGMMKL